MSEIFQVCCCFLLFKAMEETMKKDEKKFRFLIDGFPRNEDNLQGWNSSMEGKADVKFVLFFDCGNEVSHGNHKTGSLFRFRELLSSEPVYTEHVICLICQQVCINRCLERGKSSGRTDDNRESLEKRLSSTN